MELVRFTRENLNYARRFRHQMFVIKLGERVLPNVEESNLLGDICSLSQAGGVYVVLAHGNPNLNIDNWFPLYGIAESFDIHDIEGVHEWLATSHIPVVCCADPTSPENEDEAVARLAVRLKAHKLFFLTHADGIFYKHTLVRQATVEEFARMLEEDTNEEAITGRMRGKAKAAIMACREGVERAYIINGTKDGSLLAELFTCKGEGTMIYTGEYTQIRAATESDLGEIVLILKDNVERGLLDCSIVYGDIAKDIRNLLVFEVDKQVHGCILIKARPEASAAEVMYATVSEAYKDADALEMLFKHAILQVQRQGHKRVFLSAEKNPIDLTLNKWFLRLAFKKPVAGDLILQGLKHKRSKKIWMKELEVK